MNDARETRGRRCPGQALVEFAIVATILLGLTLVVIDLARAGLMQHDLDSGASDLARSLAAITGVNNSGNTRTYTPTALDPTAAAILSAVAHAAQIANYNFNATPSMTATGPVTQTGSTLTNGQVTVAVTPTLSAPTEITVTITAPFTPVVGFYLNHSILSLQARSSAITPLGELGP